MLRKVLELAALEDARLWAALGAVYDNSYVVSATADALTRLGEELGIPRPYLPARGTVKLKLKAALPTGHTQLTLPRVPGCPRPAGTTWRWTRRWCSPPPSANGCRPSPRSTRARPQPRPEPAQPEGRQVEPGRHPAGRPGRRRAGRRHRAGGDHPHRRADRGRATGSRRPLPATAAGRARSIWTAEAIGLAVATVPGVRQVQVFDGRGGLDLNQSIFGNFTFIERVFSTERDLGNPYYVTVLVAPTAAAIWDGPDGLHAAVESVIEDLRPVGIFASVDRADEVGIGVEADLVIRGLPLPTGSKETVNASTAATELRARLHARLRRCVDELPFGEPVRAAEVIWTLMNEPGVADVRGLRLVRFPADSAVVVTGSAPTGDGCSGYRSATTRCSPPTRCPSTSTGTIPGRSGSSERGRDDRHPGTGGRGRPVRRTEPRRPAGGPVPGHRPAGGGADRRRRHGGGGLDQQAPSADRGAAPGPGRGDRPGDGHRGPGGTGERVLPPVVFAPWSAAGASVPAYVPDTADEPLVASFPVAVTAERAVDGAAATAVTGTALPGLVELAVLEGNLGRLLYLVSYEKHRLRRAAREVHAYRTLAHARRDALDRIGADVGVARFVDELVHEPANGEVYARRLAPPAREPDGAYAHRLGLYRRFLLPTRARCADCSTAPARTPTRTPGCSPTCPAAHGSQCGRTTTGSRWRSGWSPPVIRSTARTSSPNCAATVSSCPRTPHRTTPCTPAGATGEPVDRGHRAAGQPASVIRLRQRARRRAAAGRRPGPGRAGLSGARLGDRVAGDPGPGRRRWQPLRAGPRCGRELADPAQATDLRNRVLDANRAVTDDRTAEALIAAARAGGVPAVAADGELAWLWRVCGLATTHRISTTQMYLSHLPTRGWR
ncbi:hypothetical protein NKG94_11030 [Micromonospora sp. M12]